MRRSRTRDIDFVVERSIEREVLVRILALDPGVTTGWALFSQSHPTFGEVYTLQYGQMGPEPHHQKLFDMLHTTSCLKQDVVVVESYQRQPTAHGLLTPVEYIGVVKLHQQVYGCILIEQSRSCKAFWTNEKLRILEHLRVGQPHAMDALRHLLYYITKSGDDQFVQQLKALTS